MYRRKSILVLSVFLIVAISACNLPSGAPDATQTPDLALTVTALASGAGQPQNQTPGSGNVPPAGDQSTATPQFTATTALSATPSVPQVTVSVDTNCREGPGLVYNRIGGLVVGQIAQIVGKNSGVPNYWVVKLPNSSTTCWLWGEYATVTGNTSNLPEYPVPPTPTPTSTPTSTPTATPSAPAPVNNVTMDMACPNANHSGTLKWEDKSSNEDGFNIYINGNLVASIPANSTTYNVVSAPGAPFAPGIASIFEVEAFNGAGKAAKKSVTKGCNP